MFKIHCLDKISKIGTANFSERYEVGADITESDAVLVRSSSMHDMDFSENLLSIARAGAGVNNIPLSKCTDEGIVVFNTPGANANSVKEIVISALFMSSRRIVPAIEWAKTLKGKGNEVSKLVEKGKSAFAGPEILGKKLGVIGLGAIGVLVANAAESLGMEVYGYDPYLSIDAAWSLSRSIVHAQSLDDIYRNCDYITVHVPLTDDTKNFINKESLEKMKDSVRILNFSRGELVNSDDVIEALNTGKLASYATDFPDDKVIGVEGIIAIPHLGASTPESEDNCAIMAVKQTKNYLKNGNINNSVNMPNLELARDYSCKRICILHRNIQGMIASFTSICSDNSLNIENMASKSRGEVAYTVLDVKSEVTDSIKSTIDSLEGVLRVRVL